MLLIVILELKSYQNNEYINGPNKKACTKRVAFAFALHNLGIYISNK
jgi:hypothetical protein